jgi:hypothetical protein
MRIALFVSAGATLVVTGLNACGGGSDATVGLPSPLVPARISIAGGNNQSATLRNDLPSPLTVEVTTASGFPVRDVKVDWTVIGDGGMVGPDDASLATTTSVLTDFMGRASVNWNIGTTAGAKSVSAAVTGISSPATFHAIAIAAPIVLHFDGGNWTTSLKDNHGAISAVRAVWGSSVSDVFVGGGGCDGPFIVHFNGTSWEDTPSCNSASFSLFTSIWGNSSSDVFALRRNVLPPSLSTDVVHYDGQSWSTVYTYSPGSFRGLNAIWSRSANDVYAVGDNGVILHFDGTNWNAEASGTTESLRALWGDNGSASVFAVGDLGTIVYNDGTAWRALASGTTQALFAISGASANDVFAVGGSGTILHYDGTAWTAQTSGTTQPLFGVWENSSAVVFAVGEASTILLYDGSEWLTESTSASMTLRGIWGASPTDVFVVGEQR